MGMKVLRGEATKIDAENKKVHYKTSDGIESIDYDGLIISVGAYPFLPPIPGAENNEHLFMLHTLPHAEKLDAAIEKAKTAVVIGAGAIGLETAYALKHRGLIVTVVEMLPALFPKALDEDVSKLVEEYLLKKGIALRLGKKLDKINKNEVHIEGEKIIADVIVMATGVRPCIKLAGDVGIMTGKFGIEVNESMETNVKDIYAAGDCITINSIITKKPHPAWLATTAYKQGTVAGTNAAGGSAKLKGTDATFVSVIGDLEVAATGLTAAFASQNGFESIVGKSKSTDLPEWMPGAEELSVKILADKKTQKIIGAQAVGKGAASRINIVSTAITAGMTLQELYDVEFAYCPAVSQSYDVLTSAVEIALRKLN